MDTIQIPEWVIDEVLPYRRHAATMLIIAMYRYGSPLVDPETGARLVSVRMPRRQLAKLARLSERSLDRAITDLVALGELTQHVSPLENSAATLTWPVDHARVPISRAAKLSARGAAKLAAPIVSTVPPNLPPLVGGGGGPDPDTDPDQGSEIPDPTTTTRARAIARDLAVLTITEPEDWIARFGIDAVADQLDALEAQHPFGWRIEDWHGKLRAAGIRNPAGLLWKRLEAAERRAVTSRAGR